MSGTHVCFFNHTPEGNYTVIISLAASSWTVQIPPTCMRHLHKSAGIWPPDWPEQRSVRVGGGVWSCCVADWNLNSKRFSNLVRFPAAQQRMVSGRSSIDQPRETPTSTFPWRATSTRTSPSTWSSDANLCSTSSTSSSPVCSSPSWPRLSTTFLLTVSAEYHQHC